jgi:formylmethanofuran dehydrogenase subunit C
MSPLVFTLREAPAQRLDLAPLTPDRLVGLSQSRIAAIQLQTTRDRVLAGDVFKIRMGDPMQTRFEGGSERFDRIGAGMSQGEVSVDGDVGAQAGRFMRGGTLVIAGNAGPWAASGMTDGSLTISGHAGDRLGGPLAGETVGMRGGVVIVRGNAGARAGDRMRRGMIIVEGKADTYLGSRMIAGTIVVRGRAGRLPGYLMNRGTIVTVDGSDALSPTFADSGVHELLATAMMARYVETYSPEVAAMLRRPWRRLLGDMAVIGKGEIFYPSVPD